MRNEARVMVATNAFGLGIDKPDTRFVIHYQLPGPASTAYYQESPAAPGATASLPSARCSIFKRTRRSSSSSWSGVTRG